MSDDHARVVELEQILEWVADALAGRKMVDFALSFGIVRAASDLWDLNDANTTLLAEKDKALTALLEHYRETVATTGSALYEAALAERDATITELLKTSAGRLDRAEKAEVTIARLKAECDRMTNLLKDIRRWTFHNQNDTAVVREAIDSALKEQP